MHTHTSVVKYTHSGCSYRCYWITHKPAFQVWGNHAGNGIGKQACLKQICIHSLCKLWSFLRQPHHTKFPGSGVYVHGRPGNHCMRIHINSTCKGKPFGRVHVRKKLQNTYTEDHEQQNDSGKYLGIQTCDWARKTMNWLAIACWKLISASAAPSIPATVWFPHYEFRVNLIQAWTRYKTFMQRGPLPQKLI